MQKLLPDFMVTKVPNMIIYLFIFEQGKKNKSTHV